MQKRIAIPLALVLLCVPGWVQAATTQETAGTEKTKNEATAPATAYRLDFSLNESEEGKKVNTRQYSMNLQPNNPESLKIGSRVPVESEQGKFQYLDIGTNIKSRLIERDNGLDLSVWADESSIAFAEPSGRLRQPIVRQLSIEAGTIVTLGKPVLIGSVDDPGSKRQFQLEFTVTKLK